MNGACMHCTVSSRLLGFPRHCQRNMYSAFVSSVALWWQICSTFPGQLRFIIAWTVVTNVFMCTWQQNLAHQQQAPPAIPQARQILCPCIDPCCGIAVDKAFLYDTKGLPGTRCGQQDALLWHFRILESNATSDHEIFLAQGNY